MPSTKLVAVDKAWVSEGYKRIVGLGRRIMAGTDYMEKHDMLLYSCRAKATEFDFEDANYSRKIVAKEIGL